MSKGVYDVLFIVTVAYWVAFGAYLLAGKDGDQ